MLKTEKVIHHYINKKYLLPKKFNDHVFFYFNDEMVIVYNYKTKNVLRCTTFINFLVTFFGIDEKSINHFVSNWCEIKIKEFSNLGQIQSLF